MVKQNSSGYSRIEIEHKLKASIENIDTLYQQRFINYRGKTTDTKETYAEVTAEILFNIVDVFDKVNVISRKNSYRVKNHNGTTANAHSNREEERIALGMFGGTFNHIGRIVDYQVPLKSTNKDIGVGKIDLLSLIDGRLIILELKKENSKETLLRCVLEAATYWRKIDREKLIRDYIEFSADTVEMAVYVFKNSMQHEQYNKKDSYTRKLMEQLKVGIYFITSKVIDGQNFFEVEIP